MKKKNATFNIEQVGLIAAQESKVTSLEVENRNLYEMIGKLKKDLDHSNAKLKHLEELLKSTQENKEQSNLSPISDEQTIAEVQLNILKQKALFGELSLDELKKYDILVKNKNLSKGQSPINAKSERLPPGITIQELSQLASKKPEENEQ